MLNKTVVDCLNVLNKAIETIQETALSKIAVLKGSIEQRKYEINQLKLKNNFLQQQVEQQEIQINALKEKLTAENNDNQLNFVDPDISEEISISINDLKSLVGNKND